MSLVVFVSDYTHIVRSQICNVADEQTIEELGAAARQHINT